MSTGINVTKPIKILDEGVLLTSDVSQIDFTGGVTATTSGNNVTVNVPAAGITVGTTPITSGTDGRVFFQSGSVVQQDAGFLWDNTNKRLGIGITPSVELDVNGRFNFYQRNNGLGKLSLINNTGTGNFLTFNYTAVGYPSANMFTAGVGFNFVGGNNYHGEITLSRTAPSALLTTRIGASNDSYLRESNLVLGATTAGARLDVRSQGALSTDIAFRVRNSADTLNTIQISGDGYLAMGGSPITMGLAPTHTFRGLTSTNNRGLFCVTNSSNTIRLGVGTSGIGLGVAPVDGVALTSDFAVTDAFAFKISGVTKFSHTKYYSNYDLFSFNRTISFASSSTDATVNITATTNKAHLKLDVASAPSGTHLDNGVMWHESNNFGFRVNGATIKIYQETTAVASATLVGNAGTNITDTDTFDGYTLQQVVKALKNLGILA